jgi:hypothetical protein
MKTTFFAVMLCAFTHGSAQSIFDNPITGTNPNTSNPYTIGQTVDANLTVSGIGRGSGITGSAANNRYSATQWNSAAIDVNDYFEFTLTPNAGKTISFISFVYTGQASGTGPLNFAVRSSLDGFTADIGTPLSTGATISLVNIAYQNIAAAITFRFYGWNASSGTGTFSINDFTFNGVTAVLPVIIEYFHAVQQNDLNLLTWKVDCSHASTAILEVERSSDGIHFSTVNSITATAIRCLQAFSFTDQYPLKTINYYRLKMTDEAGKISYSNVAVLLNKATGFAVTGFLNIVTGKTVILDITAAKKMLLYSAVTDIAGRTVIKNNHRLNVGGNPLQINVGQLAPGIYQLSFYCNDEIKTVRFIKQ